MAALSNTTVLLKIYSPLHLSSGSAVKSVDQYIGSSGPNNLSFKPTQIQKKQISTSRRGLTVQAGYRDDGRSGNASVFVGGFLLGGLIFGTLGCLYAPQISKALLGPEKKELTEKVPKFIEDKGKALEPVE